MIREVIAAAHLSAHLHVVNDGEKAMEFIDRADSDETAHCPSLFLLDLNLPKRSGAEILRHVRNSRKFANALVVIITTSDSELDRAQTAQLGANAYFRKPFGYDAFLRLGDVIKRILAPQRST